MDNDSETFACPACSKDVLRTTIHRRPGTKVVRTVHVQPQRNPEWRCKYDAGPRNAGMRPVKAFPGDTYN
jgi:hypothetical protein